MTPIFDKMGVMAEEDNQIVLYQKCQEEDSTLHVNPLEM
jgi:hypothetical protein